jgi:hypothetical protein
MQILGEYREQMVLIGGWVPYFLFGTAHVGSTDVDLALDRDEISDDVYETIRGHLEKHGYKEADQKFRFVKSIKIDQGEPITVAVDFLAGEYGGTGRSHRHQNVQDPKVRKARGCELALEHHTRISIEGTMPGGAVNTVHINLSDVVPFIVMKGMALFDRMKEKDAWDIYFCIREFPAGHTELAEQFKTVLDNGLVREGLSKIRSKFLSPEHFGPTAITDFDEISDKAERERVNRDAFERISTLLDILRIDPFEDHV